MNVMAVEPTNSHFYGLCSGGTNLLVVLSRS